jgi:hypothetical protein
MQAQAPTPLPHSQTSVTACSAFRCATTAARSKRSYQPRLLKVPPESPQERQSKAHSRAPAKRQGPTIGTASRREEA